MSKLKAHLSNLEKSDLVDLLLKSTHLNKSWTTQLLAYVSDKLSKANPTTDLHSLAKEQYQALASQAFPIIHQHNKYGGGDDDEYELVDDLLTRINKLFATHQLTHELKREYVDQLFKYYDWGNSGFTDILMDAIFAVSESVEEWNYVISLLQRKPRHDYSSHYRLSLILEIYRDHLKDEPSYFNLRRQNLDFSGEYLELVSYFWDKGNHEQAVTTAKEGFAKHHSSDLSEWLFIYYRDSDYTQALTYLRQIFENSADHLSYSRLQKYAKASDWALLEPDCRSHLDKHKPRELAMVQLAAHEYASVLTYVLSPSKYQYGTILNQDKEPLALQLFPHYPRELLPLYIEKVNIHISSRTRDGYRLAAGYVNHIKTIYIKHLNSPDDWAKYITSLRAAYTRLPALLDELSKL